MLKKTVTARSLVITLMIALCLGGTPHWALAKSTPAGAEAGIGIGTFLVNFVYTPTKVVYAILGSFTGGVAYALSGGDKTVACRIWTPALRGTYVLTPDHLRGTLPIRFAGLPPEEDTKEAAEGAQADLPVRGQTGKTPAGHQAQ